MTEDWGNLLMEEFKKWKANAIKTIRIYNGFPDKTCPICGIVIEKLEDELAQAEARGIQKAIDALEEEFARQVTSKPRELIQDSVLAGWSQSIRYLQSLLPKDSNQ